MHFCVLGAGGLGGVIGARLAEAGNRVSLVARPAHVEAIRAHGLRITGISGDRVVRANIDAHTDPNAIDGAIDWLVLVVKVRDTAPMLAAAAALLPRIGGAFSLQNSVTKDDELTTWAGASRVIGASTTEAGVVTGPGTVRHTATAPVAFYFGERDGTISTRVESLAASFTNAGLASAPTATIAQVEWEKLLQISAVAGFCASAIGHLRGPTFGHALATRSGAAHYAQLSTELLAVYRALGHEPQDFFAPFATFRRAATLGFDDAVADAMALGADMVARGIGGRPSLHEDLLRGRPTEVEASLGAFIAEADRLGMPVPTVRAAHRIVLTLEALAQEFPP